MSAHAFESPGEYFLHILSNWCSPEPSRGVLSSRKQEKSHPARALPFLWLGCVTLTLSSSSAKWRILLSHFSRQGHELLQIGVLVNIHVFGGPVDIVSSREVRFEIRAQVRQHVLPMEPH